MYDEIRKIVSDAVEQSFNKHIPLMKDELQKGLVPKKDLFIWGALVAAVSTVLSHITGK